jgi:putative FmdB family regulatory protein
VPIYEYLCVDCERIWEELKPMRQSDAETRCGTCGAVAEKLSPSSFTPMTMRDGYPRRITDDGTPYGPIGPYTTGATPEQKAKALAAERRREKHGDWSHKI